MFFGGASGKLLFVYPVQGDHILVKNRSCFGKGLKGVMDKLTVRILSSRCETIQRLYECLIRRTDSRLNNSTVEWQSYKDYSEINVSGLKQLHKTAAKKNEWLQNVSSAIAQYMLDFYEDELLGRLIRKSGLGGKEDTESVLGYCRQLLHPENGQLPEKGPVHGKTRRLKMLSDDLAAYLKENPVLNMEGFLRFRCSKYAGELREVIEYATDEYLMDQQYKEFISLLRYFVYIQDSKMPEVHLMHKGGHEFVLLNEQMKPIDTDRLDTTFKVEFLDKDYNFEDLIVSTLIAIAPQRIFIHTREREQQVIKTILQIFEDRSELCEYCRLCNPILGEAAGHQDKLSP